MNFSSLRGAIFDKSFYFYGALLCYIFAFSYSLYSWQPLLNANWSIIDDHEIISIIGSRERLPVSEIPAALSNTEVGKAGHTSRFRPSYYTLRLVEAASWGGNPKLWYATRISIAVLFAMILTAVCLRFGAPFLTFCFLIYELSRSYWADIFARLGPAETYAVFGVCLITIGVIAGEKKRWGLLASICTAVGIVIAAGSKENFVILGALPIWLIFFRREHLPLANKFFFISVLAYIAWIVESVLRGLHNAGTGTDIYSNPTSIGSRMFVLSSFFKQPDVLVWLLVSALLFFYVYRLRLKGDIKSSESQRIYRYSIFFFLLLIVYASQFVFYFGEFSPPRYQFPGIFCRHISIFLFIAIVDVVMHQNSIRFSRIHIASIFGGLCLLTATCASFYQWHGTFTFDNIRKNRITSQQKASDSNLFFGKLKDAVAYLKAHPTIPVILNSHKIDDYEPIYSLNQYLKSFGLTNPISLNIDGYSPANFSADSDKLNFLLSKRLESVELFGQGGSFIPISSLKNNVECYSLGLNGPPLSKCKNGITILNSGNKYE